MSNDAAILGRAIRAVTGKCRVCGCGGDTCNVGQGEKCMWMDELKTLCSAQRCIQVAEIAAKILAKKMERERKQVAAKVSTVPSWLRQKRERDRKHQRKTKGRVA